MSADNSFATAFPSYRRLSDEEKNEFLKASTIVLDTNILLDLYRVTPAAREEILEILGSISEKLHIPHQVASEFHKNRIRAAKGQLDSYAATCDALESLHSQAVQKVSEFSNRCALSKDERRALRKALDAAFKHTTEKIKEFEDRFDLDLEQILNADPILARISEILSGKVGVPFNVEQREAALKEAESRRKEKVPPGYKDADKTTNPHGDYFVWEQILNEAERSRSSILFISRDDKEDWVHKVFNYTIGPREELVSEIRERAGVEFQVMNLSTFLEAVKRGLDGEVSDQTLAQAEMVQSGSYGHQWKMTSTVIPHDIITPFRDRLLEALAVAKREHAKSLAKLTKAKIIEVPQYELHVIEKDAAFNESMVESKQEDIDLFEQALARAEEAPDGILVEIPEYLQERLSGMMIQVRGSRLDEADD